MPKTMKMLNELQMLMKMGKKKLTLRPIKPQPVGKKLPANERFDWRTEYKADIVYEVGDIVPIQNAYSASMGEKPWKKIKITSVGVGFLGELTDEERLACGVTTDTIDACGDHPELLCYVTVPDDNHAYVTAEEAHKVLWNNCYEGTDWMYRDDLLIWKYGIEWIPTRTMKQLKMF